MSKVLINEVMLGKRSVGFECYSMESQDIVGMTAKQIRDSFAEGKPVLGFKIDSSGELVIDCDFCKNYMVKSGIGSLTPKFDTDCIVNLMYTVVGKAGNEFEVISSRFYHGMMAEEKLKALYELGAVNGVCLDSKGKIQMVKLESPVALSLQEQSANENEVTQ